MHTHRCSAQPGDGAQETACRGWLHCSPVFRCPKPSRSRVQLLIAFHPHPSPIPPASSTQVAAALNQRALFNSISFFTAHSLALPSLSLPPQNTDHNPSNLPASLHFTSFFLRGHSVTLPMRQPPNWSSCCQCVPISPWQPESRFVMSLSYRNPPQWSPMILGQR